jgi:hypothetical protein
VNKPINLHYFYPYIHIFLFFLPFIFIFLLYFGPAQQNNFWGWAQRSPHGLGWTQPAQPGHWPKPVTRLGKN